MKTPTLLENGRAAALALEDADDSDDHPDLNRARARAKRHMSEVLRENDELRRQVAELKAAVAVEANTARIAQESAGELAVKVQWLTAKVQELECALTSVSIPAVLTDGDLPRAYAVAKGR